jgi:hypothetical protein
LRDAFTPLAASYRRRARRGYIAIGGFLGCVLVAMLLPNVVVPWFLIPAMIFWLIALGSTMTAPRLVCPGCSNEMEGAFGKYCPECGSPTLGNARWFRAPNCTACGKSMRRGKGRYYKIRACTHCGLMLDEKGL